MGTHLKMHSIVYKLEKSSYGNTKLRKYFQVCIKFFFHHCKPNGLSIPYEISQSPEPHYKHTITSTITKANSYGALTLSLKIAVSCRL